MRLNPYTPYSGMFPTCFAGREALINEEKNYFMGLRQNCSYKSVIFYGLCGVGKTVLLNYIRDLAEQNGVLSESIEPSENGGFKNQISLCAQKFILRMSPIVKDQGLAAKALSILKAFQFTYGASSESALSIKMNPKIETLDFEYDLSELFIAMGTLARDTGSSICLFIDEIQHLKTDELGALLTALFQVKQMCLPFMLIGTGLPQIKSILGRICPYSESLFIFREISPLSDADAKLALMEPAQNEGVSFSDGALEKILEITGNYPYFIQEFASQAWKYIENDTIGIKSVRSAIPDFEAALDSGFFKVRFDKATNRQKLFMYAMLDCGGLPCTISRVAAHMHTEVQRIYPLRAQLTGKELIYSSQDGAIDFTVPHFEKFLQRNVNLKPVLD